MDKSDGDTSEGDIAKATDTLADALQAIRALPQGADLFRTLFLAHPDGLALIVKGRIALVNDRFAKMSGYSTQEAIGMAPSDVVVQEDQERLHDRIADLHQLGPVYPSSYTLLCKDGSHLPIDAHSSPMQHDGETVLISVLRDISDRKQAEEALRHSLERYATLYQLASDAFLNVHPDGEILDVNAAAADLLGYTMDELRALSALEDIIAPEVFEETKAAWTEQLETQDHFRVDTLWLRKDGSRVPVSVSGKPLTVDGQVQLQLSGRDISERLKAEEALRALEDERYRGLLEVAPDGIVIVDGAGVIEAVNARTEELFGFVREELIGRPVEVLIPEAARQQHPAQRQAYVAAPTPRLKGPDMGIFGTRKNGSQFPAEISLNSMQTPDGIRVIAAVRDVTDRVLADKALRDSELRFSTAFHDNPVPVAITKMRDGKLIDVNDAFLSLTGYRRGETIGRTTTELGVPLDPNVREEYTEAVREQATVRDFPIQLRNKTGDIIDALVTMTQIELEGEPCLLTTIVDITERKRLEAELQAMRDDLEGKIERQMERANTYKLTFREYTVLHLIAAGKADKEIAADLGISIFTVHRHVSHILTKMNSPSRTEAGTRALREGLLD